MSRRALQVLVGVVLLALGIATVYSAVEHDTGVTVLLFAAILLVAIALAIVVSRAQE